MPDTVPLAAAAAEPPAPVAPPDGFCPADWYERHHAPFRAGILVRQDRSPRLLEQLPPA